MAFRAFRMLELRTVGLCLWEHRKKSGTRRVSLWDLTSSMGMTWAYPPPAAPPKQQSGHRWKGVTKGSYTDEQSPRGHGSSHPTGSHVPPRWNNSQWETWTIYQRRTGGGESSHHVQLCNLRLSFSSFQKRVKIILRMLLQQTCGFLNWLYLWSYASFKLHMHWSIKKLG